MRKQSCFSLPLSLLWKTNSKNKQAMDHRK